MQELYYKLSNKSANRNHLAEIRDEWRALFYTKMKVWLPQKAWNTSICFSRCLCCSCYMCVRQAVLRSTGLPDKNMSHCAIGVHVADAYKRKLLPCCPCKSR